MNYYFSSFLFILSLREIHVSNIKWKFSVNAYPLKSIRFNQRQQSEWIRANSKPSFQSKSIRMNPRSEWFGLKTWFRIHSDCCLWLNRIRSDPILPFFIKRVTKRFSDWFGMIRIGSDTDIGMNRNNSNCFWMNPYPVLSPE